ncbi:MAG: acyl-CoA thioesterase [Candidatus Omnitrophica bacterium]|nr:acyl-CoA thioesterase [Candidatus Omnitrophota bacterium]
MKVFDYKTRVRYAETDQMGISYYANYFIWFEAARTEYFREIGFVYSEFEKQGILLPVAEAHCRYLGPSSYDDMITIRTVVSQIRQSSIRFDYRVLKDPGTKPIATGYTVHVFSGPDLKPIRIPEVLKSKVEVTLLEA